MRLSLFILVSTLLVHGIGLANDSEYAGEGSSIYPIKSSLHSLDREHLSFRYINGRLHVRATFEINNPTSSEDTIRIGFDAPMGNNGKSIENFTTVYERQHIATKAFVTTCDTCAIRQLGENVMSNDSLAEVIADFEHDSYPNFQGTIVYISEIVLRPGINVISHSYIQGVDTGIEACASYQQYHYILSTGARWAGGKIGRLTIDIDMSDHGVFYVSPVADSNNWKIVGTGVVGTEYSTASLGTTARQVRILDGFLRIELENFTPTNELSFGSEVFYNRINKACTAGIDDTDLAFRTMLTQSEQLVLRSGEASIGDLSRIKDVIYAFQGASFIDPVKQALFESLWWYMPRAGSTPNSVALEEYQRSMIDVIDKEVAARKN